ncbi:TldD/PmbA family protein [Candidatus Altiarchaeota archaeon]
MIYEKILKDREADILAAFTEAVEVEILGGKIDSTSNTVEKGVGIRVLVDGQEGLAHTQDERFIESCLRKAEEIARLRKGLSTKLVSQGSYPSISGLFDPKLDAISPEELVEEASYLNQLVREKELLLAQGSIAKNVSSTRLENSLGLEVEEKASSCTVFASIVAGGTSTGFDYHVSRKKDYDLGEIASKACDLAQAAVNPVKLSQGAYPVLFEPTAVADLLTHLLIPSLNSDRVQRGKSKLAGKIGEDFASPALTIFDDGTLDGGLNSCKCDGEGVGMQKKTLIEKGVLNCFLYDVKRALKEGKESTGNGLRGYDSLPEVGPTNFVVGPGGSSREELLKEAKGGLLVHSIVGVHTANPTSGDFAVELENTFFIEGGERGKAVKKGILTGNMFDVLKKISLVGKESKQTGVVVTPPILTEPLKVVA